MRFRFYIDSELIDNDPEGWDDFEVTIKRNEQERLIYLEYRSKLTLCYGSGFEQVYAYLEANNYGAIVDFEAQYSIDNGDTWTTLFEGVIDVSEAQFDLHTKTVEVGIRDRSLATYIVKNASLKVSTGQTRSKNSVIIDAITAQNLTIQNESKQGTRGRSVKAYYLYELIQYIVDYITDRKVDVDTGWLFNQDKTAFLMPIIWLETQITEIELQSSFSARPRRSGVMTTSFNEAYTDYAKLYNLWAAMVKVSGDFKLIIDEEDSMYSASTAITLTEIAMKKVRIRSDKMYTSIIVGNEDLKTQDIFYTAVPSLAGWSETELQVKGQSNVRDQVLDLRTSFVYSGIELWLRSLEPRVLDDTSASTFVVTAAPSGSEKNILLFSEDATEVLMDVVGSEVYIAEMDEAASVTDIDSYVVTEMLTDPTNITVYTDMFNDDLTNNLIVARQNIPFDVYLSSNPDPALDVTLLLNADTSQYDKTADPGDAYTLDQIDIIPFRSNISGASDSYNQWDNTSYAFQPSAATGRVDEFTMSGSLRINIVSTTAEGYRVMLFIISIIDDVSYYDRIYRSSVQTSTGQSTIAITSRSYVPFSKTNIFKLGLLIFPESLADLWDMDWDNFDKYLGDHTTPDTGWAETTSGGKVVTIKKFQASGVGLGVYFLDWSGSLEIGADYTFSVTVGSDIVGGDATFEVVSNSVILATGYFADTDQGVLTATFTAAATLIYIRVEMTTVLNDSRAVMTNPSLLKEGAVSYTIKQNAATVVNIDQEGFDGTSYTNADEANYKGYEVEFEAAANAEDAVALMNDPRKRIVADGTVGWVNEIQYKPSTGKISGTLITDFTNLNL